MDRITLEARVAELTARHTGPEFIEAVERFAEGLDDRERELLARILLERSTDSFRDAIAARVESQGWLRRQWTKLDEGRPPRA
jgi:flagellar biosynthesis regulator FlaF